MVELSASSGSETQLGFDRDDLATIEWRLFETIKQLFPALEMEIDSDDTFSLQSEMELTFAELAGNYLMSFLFLDSDGGLLRPGIPGRINAALEVLAAGNWPAGFNWDTNKLVVVCAPTENPASEVTS